MIKNYFAKKAIERQKRRLEKGKLTDEQILLKVKDIQDKVQKYQAALSLLTNILEGV